MAFPIPEALGAHGSDMGRKTDPYPNTTQVPPSGPGKLTVEEPRALVRSHTLASFLWDIVYPLPPSGTGATGSTVLSRLLGASPKMTCTFLLCSLIPSKVVVEPLADLVGK